MKYQVLDGKDHLLIKLSGDTKKNQALVVKKMLSPYLKRKRMKVVVDLKQLVRFEPVTLVGVLNSIKKRVDLLNGQLKLCYLNPEITFYFRKNRLHRIFKLCNDEEDVARNKGQNVDEG